MNFILNDYYRDISDEDLLNDVKKVAEKLSQNTLTQKEYKQAGGKFSSSTFRHRFGGWMSVLNLCGLDANLHQLAAHQSKHLHQFVDNQDLLEDIRQVAIMLDKETVSKKEYDKYGRFSSTTCYKRFPSWNDVLNAAGLNPIVHTSEKRLNDEEMLQDIERIWIKLGRQPTSSDIKKGVSKYSLHAYAEHFGGWRGALEAFIEYINSDIPDKKDVIDSELCNVGDDKEEIKAKTDIHSQNDIKHKTSRNVSPGIRWKVMQRDNFKCRICGASPSTDSSVQLHIDHIVPWSKGGETTYENLQILCSKCNLGKGDMV